MFERKNMKKILPFSRRVMTEGQNE